MSPPRDNIVRTGFPGPDFRAASDDTSIGMLTGRFAVFDQWTEINSAFEGNFLERIAPGAFTKTFENNRAGMRVLFQHGQDPQVGDKPLGPITELREDAKGGYYEVPLMDTSYNRDLLPGLKAGLYGASFRFHVEAETIDNSPKKSQHNPEGLPERTITEAFVHEFGPVTFPAYAGASAGVRSGTDEYLRSLSPVTPPQTTTPRKEPIPVTDTATEYTSREERAARVTELDAEIARLAQENPGGELPAESQSRFDQSRAEIAMHERAIAAWDARVAFAASRVRPENEDVPRTETGTAWTPPVARNQTNKIADGDIYDMGLIAKRANGFEDLNQRYRDNALRSIETVSIPTTGDVDGARQHMTKLVEYTDSADKEIARRILLTGSPIYRRAFHKYLRDGNQMGHTPDEQRAAALAVTGTTTTGGYAVPYIFDPTFIAIGAHTSVNPYRAACRVETISGGNNWRAVTATAITAKWDTEAAVSVEGGPTIGQPTFTVQRADAFATVSIETLQDRPDIGDELTKLFQEGKDNLEENSFTLGTGGTVFPFGMFRTLAFTATTTTTNDVTAKADIYKIEAALPIRHRANAAWFMSRSTIRQIQAMESVYGELFGGVNYAAVGNPQQNPTGNTGLRLIGYPVWEVPSAVSTLTTDAAIIAVFGDPKNYVIVDRVGLNVEVIANMLDGSTPSFPTGQRGIYAYWRATARPLNVDGMRQLTVQ